MIKHTQAILRKQLMNCLSVFDHFVMVVAQMVNRLSKFLEITLTFSKINSLRIKFQ